MASPHGAPFQGFLRTGAAMHTRTPPGSAGVSVILQPAAPAVSCFMADGAYDTTAVYDLLTSKGARVVVPPMRKRTDFKGRHCRSSCTKRDRERRAIAWPTRMEEAVRLSPAGGSREAFFRYKQLIGGRLRSRNLAGQGTEVRVAANILNRMLELGAWRSEPIHN